MSDESVNRPPVDKEGAVITALKMLRQTPWHTVAEGIGDGGAAVVVRTFRVVDAEGSSPEQIAQERKIFAESLHLQQEMGDAGAGGAGSGWAKVRRICDTRTELYGVMEKCQGSVAGLVEHCVPANPKLLYEMSSDVLGALDELWKARQRSHENLKAGNILEKKGSGAGRSSFLLADPAHAGKKDTSANDFFELGNILFELVEHKKFDAVNGRIHGSGQWDRLGGQKRRWIEFCECLLNPAGCQESLADVKKRVARLKPPSKVMRSAAAAVILAVLAAGGVLAVKQLRHPANPTIIVTTAPATGPSVVELRIQALQDLFENQKVIDKPHFDSLSALVVMSKPPENAFDQRRLEVFLKAQKKELTGDQIMAALNQIDKDDPAGAERAQKLLDAKVTADLAAAQGLLQKGDLAGAIDGLQTLLVVLPKEDARRKGVQDLLDGARNQRIDLIFAAARGQLDQGDLAGANAALDDLTRRIGPEDAPRLKSLQLLRSQLQDMRISARIAEAQRMLPGDPRAAIKIMDELEPTIAPADAKHWEDAKKLRATATVLLSPEKYLNRAGLNLVRIMPGSFMMGSPETEMGALNDKTGKPEHVPDEVLHKVTLTKGFYMAAELVTVEQFQLFVEQTGYVTDAERLKFSLEYLPADMSGTGRGGFIHVPFTWKEPRGHPTPENAPEPGRQPEPAFQQSGDSPATCLDQRDAEHFCEWLTKFDGHAYRLPTEAEWEYCCRAGTQTTYFWGNDPGGGKDFVNAAGPAHKHLLGPDDDPFPFEDGYYYTCPVDAMKPNAWGLHDMLGNLWQWTSTNYADYPRGDETDPNPPAGPSNFVVSRGGAWGTGVFQSRAAYRWQTKADYRDNGSGFRVVAELFQADPALKVEVVHPTTLPATAPAGSVGEMH